MVVGHDRRRAPNGTPHVLFYGHYDVQPPDPLELWKSPPFEPRIATDKLNGKVIVARGAEDNKGQLMTFFEAARAWKSVAGDLPVAHHRAARGRGGVRLAVAAGLPRRARQGGDGRPGARLRHRPVGQGHAGHLHAAARPRRHRDRHHRPEPRSAFGQLRRPGASTRSACSPASSAEMHDDAGKVRIPGFYDGIKKPSAKQLEQWAGLGFDDRAFLGDVGLSQPAGERRYGVLEQIWARPTRGVQRHHRRLPGRRLQDRHPVAGLGEDHLPAGAGPGPRRRCSKAIEALRAGAAAEGLHGRVPRRARLARPSPSTPRSPHIARAAQALEEEWGRPTALIGMGGSIPIVTSFKEALGMDSLLVGFGLDDDRIHSPNEKYNLTSLPQGRAQLGAHPRQAGRVRRLAASACARHDPACARALHGGGCAARSSRRRIA